MEVRAEVVELEGLQVGLVRYPGAGATPLLALHGFGGSGRDFAPFADALGRACDRPLLAPDLLGHGASSAPREAGPYALDLEAARLDRLRARLGLERCVLLGYSLGGRVALTLALERPGPWLAGLVLVGATPGLADPAERAARRKADHALAARLERDGVPAFEETWRAQPLIATQERIEPEALAAMRARRLQNRAHGLANSLRGAGTGAMTPLWSALPRLDVPTLLVTGAEDTKFAAIASEVVRRAPHAEHAAIACAGHCAHLERPDACARRVVEWLSEVEGH
ncbi:MAG: 2-succinyl-6-hydroxy-2,4-cyclohexadiene-1-carboxylate synthase [Planctomycetota bacterium]